MREYKVIIMSEDGDEEDNHQKYLVTVNAKNKDDAIEKGKAKFWREEGSDKPIHWVKVH